MDGVLKIGYRKQLHSRVCGGNVICHMLIGHVKIIVFSDHVKFTWSSYYDYYYYYY